MRGLASALTNIRNRTPWIPRYFVQDAQSKGKVAVTEPAVPSRSFKLLTYNILAGNLGTAEYFPYVDPGILDWGYRKELIVSQISAIDPDIICLQELNDVEYFRDQFSHEVYDSIYVKRPSTHTSTWSGQDKQDGCGLFFKRDKFTLQAQESVQYQDTHDRIALAALLKPQDPSSLPLLVATTHLYWNNKRVDTQLAELKQLEEWLTTLYLRFSSSLPTPPAVVVCGDMNNTPTSAIYQYLVSQFMRSPLPTGLRSAYDRYLYNPSCAVLDNHNSSSNNNNTATQIEIGQYEPKFTTLNFRRAQTIDYIWYSKENLEVCAVLELPSEEELRQEPGPEGWLRMVNAEFARKSQNELSLERNWNGIPNSKFGSDHLPIAAILRFVP